MFLEKLKQVKGIVLDVDGVLTDASVLMNESGEQWRRYNVRDGYAIKLAVKKGFPVGAISGGSAENIRLRMNWLNVEDVWLGVDDKRAAFASFLEKYGLQPAQVLFMGDDIPDLPLMKLAGLKACPADAVEEVKAVSDYISPKKGGEGCVRDVLEKMMKVQGIWHLPSDEQIPSV